MKACKTKDATITKAEREKLAENEKLIFEWLLKPKHTMWDVLGADARALAVERANEAMEDQVWFHLNKLVFPETHSEALTKFDTYLTTQLVKPFNWSVTKTLERLGELYDMRKYVPAPGEDVLTARFDEPRADLTMTEKRCIEYAILPDDWQTRVKGKMLNWLGETDARWVRILKQVETEAQLHEKQLAETEKRRKRQEQSDSESGEEQTTKTARNKARAAARRINKKSRRSTGNGQAKFCAYCKKIGRSEYAYTSHNEADCNIKNGTFNSKSDYEKDFSGNRREKANAQGHYEKMVKKQNKQFKEMRKIIKTLHRSTGNKEARAATAKADQDAIAAFMNDTDDSDEDMSIEE